MRMLNTAFNEFLLEGSPERRLNFYPSNLRSNINETNPWLSSNFNLGVYKAGFANTQEDYEENARVVFKTLDRLEGLISLHKGPYFLPGKDLTELDLKLHVTLVRFDATYVQHFKLNIGTIRHNYPGLHRFLKNMYWNVKGVKETTNFKHIKENYSKSHTDVNPKIITSLGPCPDIEPWTTEDEEWACHHV